MFRRDKKRQLRQTALNASELALQLAQDKQFRKRLLSALEHGAQARRRARPTRGIAAEARRLAADQTLHAELRQARNDLKQAYEQLDAKKRSRRFRNLTFLAGLAALIAVPQLRKRVSQLISPPVYLGQPHRVGDGDGAATAPAETGSPEPISAP